MRESLKTLERIASPTFRLAAIVFAPLAVALGLAYGFGVTESSLLMASLDSLIRVIVFVGLAGVGAHLISRDGLMARLGTGALGAGVLGSAVFAIGSFLEFLGVMGRPAWVGALIPLMLLGFVGAALLSVSAFQADSPSNVLASLLIAPLAIFVLQFLVVGGLSLPTWTVLLFVGAQVGVGLLIARRLDDSRAVGTDATGLATREHAEV